MGVIGPIGLIGRMNAPIPNYYDVENARQLAGFAAASYSPEEWDVSDEWDMTDLIGDAGTDTQAMIWKNRQDVIVAFRGTRSLKNFVTDLRCRRAPLVGGPGQAEVHEGFQQALNSVCAALHSAVGQLLHGAEDARQRVPTGG